MQKSQEQTYLCNNSLLEISSHINIVVRGRLVGLLHEVVRRGKRLRTERTRALLQTRIKSEWSTASVDPRFEGGVLSSWKFVPVFGIMHRTMSRRRAVPKCNRVVVGRMILSSVMVTEGRGARTRRTEAFRVVNKGGSAGRAAWKGSLVVVTMNVDVMRSMAGTFTMMP